MTFSQEWKCFEHDLFEQPKLEQINTENYRYYQTTEGKKFPSVTSVLSLNETQELKEWKNKVGEKEAQKISNAATYRGSKLHEMCELYLKNELKNNIDKFSMFDIMGFKRIHKLVNYIDKVHIIEGKLFSHELRCAGTIDAFGFINNNVHDNSSDGNIYGFSTIDFKTSKYKKTESQIENYFMQTAIYSKMLNELYGVMPKYVVIMIDNEFDEPSLFKRKLSDTKYYYQKFLSLRKEFFNVYGF